MLRKGLNHTAYGMLTFLKLELDEHASFAGVGGQKSETSMLKIRRASRDARQKFLRLQSSQLI